MPGNAFEHAGRQLAPWLERTARLGYASKGVVYTLIGLLTAAAATGIGGQTADRHDALQFILRQPLGRFLLVIIAVGLMGYAVWRILSGFFDSENRGHGAKGLALRTGSILRGVFYAAVAVEVLRIAARETAGKSSDAQARYWVAEGMDQPFGRWLVGVAGLIIVGYGLYQLSSAVRSKLSKKLRLGALRPQIRSKVVAVSRFGLGSRGIVFAIIGLSILNAAIRQNPNAARGTTGALTQLAEQPFGGVLLGIIGIGLAAYGIYAFINARYRIIQTR